jgi:hypothetical protein
MGCDRYLQRHLQRHRQSRRSLIGCTLLVYSCAICMPGLRCRTWHVFCSASGGQPVLNHKLALTSFVNHRHLASVAEWCARMDDRAAVPPERTWHDAEAQQRERQKEACNLHKE